MKLKYSNPNRQAYRVTLAGAGLCVLLTELAYLAPGNRFAEHAAAGMDTIYLVAFMIGAIGAVALLVVALITRVSAQKTDRAFNEFCQGELLADWHIDSRNWHQYLILEEAAVNWSNLGTLLLSLGLLALLAAFIVWSSVPSGTGRAVGLTVTVACAAMLAWLITWLWHRTISKRIAGMRDHPRVLIGRDGVYCGTLFRTWNGNMVSLHAVNVIPGEPARLEFTTGPSKSAQGMDTAITALGVILLVAGGSGGTPGVGPKRRKFQVPIPSERLADAMQLAQALLADPKTPLGDAELT